MSQTNAIWYLLQLYAIQVGVEITEVNGTPHQINDSSGNIEAGWTPVLGRRWFNNPLGYFFLSNIPPESNNIDGKASAC